MSTESVLAAVHAATQGAPADGNVTLSLTPEQATQLAAMLTPPTAVAMAAPAVASTTVDGVPAKSKFGMSDAVAFVGQAGRFNLGEQAQALVKRNEAGEISTEEARAALMEAAAKGVQPLTTQAEAGNRIAGGQEPPAINISEIYGARKSAIQAAARIALH